MNTKIYKLVQKNLYDAFNLPKYQNIIIAPDTVVDELPWTPARYRKFKDTVEAELALEDCSFTGPLLEIVDALSERYILRFFGEIWKPRRDDYNHTGWQLVEEVNKLNPKNVLDVGCGYHPFKGRIQNLIGIDPYNAAADYQVDILEYKVKHKYDVIIALGSINFNSRDEIEARMQHCVDLLETGGRFYLRANPGIAHKTGPYVDIFPWSFEIVNDYAEKYNLKLLEFKKDANNRLYFVYKKL
jgi:SAM-dependent methyltransferase